MTLRALAILSLLVSVGCDPGSMQSVAADAGPTSDAGPPSDAAAAPLDDAGALDRPDAPRTRERDAGPAGDDAGATGELPTLGTTTLLAEPCPRSRLVGAGQRCEYVEVDCAHAGTTPNLRAELRITDPVGAERGTIWLGSGSQGGAFYGGDAVSAALVRGLADAGYRVVERGWSGGRDAPGGWFTGTEGVRVASCRSATLMQYVHDHLTTGDRPFCASANSGGSVELSYAMSIWRADRFVDLAVPTSGPAVRLDYACAGASDPSWVAECEAIQGRYPLDSNVACELDGPRPLIDQAYGGRTVCTMSSPADLPTLAADSLVGAGSTQLFPSTPFRFLYGGADAMAAVTLGIDYAEALVEAGTDATIEVIPAGIHDMGDDPVGSLRILEILRDQCDAP